MSLTKDSALKRKRGILRNLGLIATLLACLFTASCASKAAQRRDIMGDTFESGDYAALIQTIKNDQKKLYGDAGAFLYNMDLGVLYHYLDQYDSSNVYLAAAAAIYDELFTRSVTNEAAAILTNDNVRPYRARPYELVMLHQIAALNFMLEGKFEEALVETRKVQILFNEWERLRADGDKYHTDGMSHLFSSLAYEAAKEPDDALISLFKSVQAFKLGPVKLPPEVEGFAYRRLKAGDRADDVGLLGITAKEGPNAWMAEQGETEIIVVGYAGRGPAMSEQTWRTTYTAGGRLTFSVVDDKGTEGVRAEGFTILAPPLPNTGPLNAPLHITLSLPRVLTYPTRTSHFSVSLAGGQQQMMTAVVNDLDLQAKKALTDAWPEIVSRTVVRVALRTIAAEAAKKTAANQADQRIGGVGGAALGRLAGAAVNVTTDQMEKADIRMCFKLPKQIHVARFPVEPGTHSVTVNVYDDRGRVIGEKHFDAIEMRQGEKRVLVHRSMM